LQSSSSHDDIVGSRKKHPFRISPDLGFYRPAPSLPAAMQIHRLPATRYARGWRCGSRDHVITPDPPVGRLDTLPEQAH
jgi:hypothetical protein